MAQLEYSYDARLDVVLSVRASSREDADIKVREILGLTQGLAQCYENGVVLAGGTVNDLPVHFETTATALRAVA